MRAYAVARISVIFRAFAVRGGAVDPEKRRHQRIHIALPVFLKGTTGVTRDVSASGMFFWTAGACTPGDLIGFEVELHRPVGKMRLKCRGDIVRTESGNASVGVAVKITESEMEEASK
jgi:hypothetical protein